MNSSGKRIARNAGFLMISQVITWVFSLVLTIMLPRYLGAEGIGQLRLAGSIWAIVMIVATFGMDTFLTREIARAPEKTGELFGTSLILRVLLFLAGGLLVAVYLQFVGYSAQAVLVIYVVGFSSLVGQSASSFDASLKGLERMEFTSLASVVSSAVLTVVRLALILLKQDVVIIAAVGIFSSAVALGIQFYFLHKLQSLRFKFRWDFARQVLAQSMPFFFVNVVIVLYHQIDVLTLSWLLDEKSIGWYGTVDQLIGALLFIPTILMTVLFPNLSRLYTTALESFYELARKVFDLMFVLSVPIGLGIMLIANQVVVLLFGMDFEKSGPILAVRGVVLILTYMNIILGLIMISTEKQKAWARVMFIAAIATIPLDLILIPLCERYFANGALGGAISYLFTDLGMFLAGLQLMPREIVKKSTIWIALRALFAGILMVGAAWTWRNSFLLLPIVVSVVVYAAFVLIFRILTKEDISVLNQVQQYIFRRVFRRVGSPTPTKG